MRLGEKVGNGLKAVESTLEKDSRTSIKRLKRDKGRTMQIITLKVNGIQQQVSATPDMVLIDLLREDLHLTGTKQSCDRKGQCGACTVIVNGKVVRSCITKVVNLEGAEVISIEGLGTPENPHLIQEAFVLSGAVQCGFCTPGMVIAAKVLLDQNPKPDVAAIKRALAVTCAAVPGIRKSSRPSNFPDGSFVEKQLLKRYAVKSARGCWVYLTRGLPR